MGKGGRKEKEKKKKRPTLKGYNEYISTRMYG